jgi:hypothetical protein
MGTGLVLTSTATVETRAWWANAIVNGGLSAVLGVTLFFVLGALGVGSVLIRTATVVAYGLGTLAFPYATAFYGHQPAAALAFLGFAGVLRATRLPDGRWSAWLGGLAAGAAVLFETSTMLVVLAIGLWLIVRRDFRSLALFAAGLLPAGARPVLVRAGGVSGSAGAMDALGESQD